MAFIKTWLTKEEVLQDLAKASGRRTRKKDDLDGGYLVIGDVPPRVVPENEDDTELEIRFGGAATRKEIQHTEEDTTPDLAGIQHMLRMMQEYNSGDDDNTNDTANAKDCVIAITKVSKLNPNVDEFQPKCFTSPSPSTNSNNYSSSPRKINISSCLSNKDINSNVVAQTVDVKTEESQKETEEEVKESGDNNLDVAVHVDKKEYDNIATTLKNQISDAAKSDSYEFKKQKNVAIATLLRLYAKSNTVAKCAAPLKLMKPEYFEGKIETPAVKVEEPLDIVSTATCSTPEPKESSTTIASCSTFSTSTTSSSTTSPKIKLDPEIKKSIDKVNKWLGEPTKSKSPAVCLGPIEFKRKESKICRQSPISDSVPNAPKPVQSQKYQPSKYAADLQKQYLERQKAIESKQKEVTWHNLEDVLKLKDLAIKRRLADQAEQGQASTSDT